MTYSIEEQWIDEAIVVITFSDQSRGNQLCWAAVDKLGEQLRSCRESGARVVILASGLAGHWLEHAWLQDLSNGLDGQPQTGTGEGWFKAPQELSDADIISIAAIAGDCSGGGAELGWACDFRIAEPQATFCQPEVNMGLTTGIGGCSRLSRLAGRTTATEMVLTGRPVHAARLYELGAISRVVEPGQALTASVALARDLVGKSPEALTGLKRILASNDEPSLDEELRHEQEVFQSVVVTDNAREGIKRTQSAYDEVGSTAETNDDDSLLKG